MSFSFGTPNTQPGFALGTSTPAAGNTGFSFGAGDANKTATSGFALTPAAQATAKPAGLGFGMTGFGTTPAPGTGFGLGSTTVTAATAAGLSFGTPTAATTAPASTGLSFATPQNTALSFGGLATTAAGGTTGFSLGGTPAASAPSSGFGLGTTAPAAGLSFGTPKPATTGYALGGPAPATGAATGLSFGAANTSTPSFGLTGTASPAATTGFSIGGTPASGTTATGLTLGTAPASTTSTAFNLGGTPAPAVSTAAQGFSLGGTTASVPATGATSFNLGGTPAASTGGFALGNTAATSVGTGFSLGGTATPTSGSGFALGKSATSQALPVSTAIATSATTLPQTTLGTITTVSASTISGAQAGAINFCQLEENINKWTLELEEQEKAFVNQATQVNAWDRLLIANGEKIVTLNQEVERVILDQQQLEHELDYVVGQQRELQDCLVPLEKELASLSVSDPEREYTYRLSENLDTQLKQMSEDLKEIIEHLNEANRSQDSGDPIVQIGKILNAHMNSLQWLDQRTALLGQKIQQIDQMHQNFRQENERSFSLAYN